MGNLLSIRLWVKSRENGIGLNGQKLKQGIAPDYMNFTVLIVYSQLPSTDGLQDVKEHQALRILDLLIRSVSDEKNKIVDFDNDSPVADEVSKFARSLEIIFSPSDLERLQELSID